MQFDEAVQYLLGLDRGPASDTRRQVSANGGRVGCANPDCDDPTQEGRKYCPRCWKRVQRNRARNLPDAHGLSDPVQRRLSPEEAIVEAAIELADAPAEDDAAYEASTRRVVSAARRLAKKATGEAIRRGLAAARARGVVPGRRPTALDPVLVARLVARLGQREAAQVLGVDRSVVARVYKATVSSQHQDGHAAGKA